MGKRKLIAVNINYKLKSRLIYKAKCVTEKPLVNRINYIKDFFKW